MNFNEKENNKQKNTNTNPVNKNRERDREREKERDRDKSENPIEKRGSNSSKNIGQFCLAILLLQLFDFYQYSDFYQYFECQSLNANSQNQYGTTQLISVRTNQICNVKFKQMKKLLTECSI